MIISIDAEEAFDQIQHPFMIKQQQKKKPSAENVYIRIIPQHNKGHI